MPHEDTLVKIIAMPSLDPHGPIFSTRFNGEIEAKGIVIKGWAAWSGQTECKLQYLDILVEGSIVRYWRPCFDGDQSLTSPGFWEIAGNRKQSYEIEPIQSFTSE